MSNNIRAAAVLFDGTEAVVVGGVNSEPGYPGPMTNVAVLIQNTGAFPATITYQATHGDTVPKAGRNADLDNAVWYNLVDRVDVANADPIQMTIPAGVARALDLSPFAPPYFRLHAVGVGGTTSLKAYMVDNG